MKIIDRIHDQVAYTEYTYREHYIIINVSTHIYQILYRKSMELYCNFRPEMGAIEKLFGHELRVIDKLEDDQFEVTIKVTGFNY